MDGRDGLPSDRLIREFIPSFAALGRLDTVAVIDGAAAPVSARPAAVSEAISGATLADGVDAYQAAFARGRAMTNEELEVCIDAVQ